MSALNCSGTLVVDGCTFTSNSAATGSGGALFSRYTDLTISATRFVNNAAGESGGAVSVHDCSLASFGGSSTFLGNKAGMVAANRNHDFADDWGSTLGSLSDVSLIGQWWGGGAISATHVWTFSLSDSTFEGNTAEYDAQGGAVYYMSPNNGADPSVAMRSCTFLVSPAIRACARAPSTAFEVLHCGGTSFCVESTNGTWSSSGPGCCLPRELC